MTFPLVHSIGDIRKAVEGKREIRFSEHPNGVTLGCYQFMDSSTFDSPEALECRGIAFGRDGRVISRPLHKFFNMGEKAWLSPSELLRRDDIAWIHDKLDGSMIATAEVDGSLAIRSKKSFDNEVTRLALDILKHSPELQSFCEVVMVSGMTAVFEITHPEAQIVVRQDRPRLRLLHVRDNQTGEYVLLDESNDVHGWIRDFGVDCVKRHEAGLATLLEELEFLKDAEGYVVQFKNGDMCKIKCPWYLRMHKSVTFLRERDIARLALNEELDDVKGSLSEVGIDLSAVEGVERSLKERLLGIMDEVDAICSDGADLDRKSFAIKNSKHPLFGLAMAKYQGKEPGVSDWYGNNRLKTDYSLKVLGGDALKEALEG